MKYYRIRRIADENMSGKHSATKVNLDDWSLTKKIGDYKGFEITETTESNGTEYRAVPYKNLEKAELSFSDYITANSLTEIKTKISRAVKSGEFDSLLNLRDDDKKKEFIKTTQQFADQIYDYLQLMDQNDDFFIPDENNHLSRSLDELLSEAWAYLYDCIDNAEKTPLMTAEK